MIFSLNKRLKSEQPEFGPTYRYIASTPAKPDVMAMCRVWIAGLVEQNTRIIYLHSRVDGFESPRPQLVAPGVERLPVGQADRLVIDQVAD